MAGHNDCPECRSSYAERLLRGELERDLHGSHAADTRAEATCKDGRQSPVAMFNPYYTGRPRTPVGGSKNASIDRQEIIRQIKSGERPGSRPASPELERTLSSLGRKRKSPEPTSQPTGEPTTPSGSDAHVNAKGQGQDCQDIGLEIERPRSALHRGDFREKDESESGLPRFGHTQRDEPTTQLSTSPVAPWHAEFPAAIRHALNERRAAATAARAIPPPARPVRSRAVSNASLTNVLYQPPTSPLVQSSRPDTPEPQRLPRIPSPDKSRRHTYSPQSLQALSATFSHPGVIYSSADRYPPSLRKEFTYPYQAPPPRPSSQSFASLPQTPILASRRPSISASPLHHAPMVGSYEESILRGRMSSTPSKPLNFVAQIGVLGKGDCPPKLRCPPHATVPFPAVFYSYGSGSSSTSSAQPSPYVGLIDIENNVPVPDRSPEKRRMRVESAITDHGSRASSNNREDGSGSDAHARRRRRTKQKRRSGSPKAPPGGSYRIPQQGQLQIVIKNPNKTAVKLFLVPYDLADMEPGQKTFIRQRSYSAGPIIDMPLSSRKNWGTDRPEAALSSSEDPNDRPMLRYLVHLHICCPSRGRYFLYKSIRVVFANRVPDGKEKLRNEIQLPEPRYSTYKPGRDSNASTLSRLSDRRRSSQASATSPTLEESPWKEHQRMLAHSLPSMDYDRGYDTPMPPLPYHPAGNSFVESHPRPIAAASPGGSSTMHNNLSPETAQALSPISSNSSGERQWGALHPRLDSPFNFERDHSRERSGNGRSESLLSRRLKGLAMQTQNGGLNGS